MMLNQYSVDLAEAKDLCVAGTIHRLAEHPEFGQLAKTRRRPWIGGRTSDEVRAKWMIRTQVLIDPSKPLVVVKEDTWTSCLVTACVRVLFETDGAALIGVPGACIPHGVLTHVLAGRASMPCVRRALYVGHSEWAAALMRCLAPDDLTMWAGSLTLDAVRHCAAPEVIDMLAPHVQPRHPLLRHIFRLAIDMHKKAPHILPALIQAGLDTTFDNGYPLRHARRSGALASVLCLTRK